MNTQPAPPSFASAHARPAQQRISNLQRVRLFLYWLAGARWSTLAQVPESERERIAVLGSSVLIPTLLAFFGMYLYAASRFHDPRPVVSFWIALVWAFLVMNVDRILLATYRPFQTPLRKAIQIIFRIGLAAVVSLAITFPFCLHQYRGAIAERLQGEYRGKLDEVLSKERQERESFEGIDAARVTGLQTKLAQDQAAGPADPHLYAEILAKQDAHQQIDGRRAQQQVVEQDIAEALAKWKQASARMAELDKHVRQEERGTLPQELGGTGKPGRAAKYGELMRDLDLARQAEQTARQGYNQLLQQALPGNSRTDRAVDGAIGNERQTAFLREAQLRKDRIDTLENEVRKAEADQAQHLADHNFRHQPVIKNYQAKASGIFDPMEETIGLFKVIFIPEADEAKSDLVTGRYKWIAALFQFSIVFATLFLLDLIAILSKVMSRPGPYDVLVEFPEFAARCNLEAIKAQYRQQVFVGTGQDERGEKGFLATNASARPGIDLRDTGAVADLLLKAYSVEKTDIMAEAGQKG